MTKILNSVRISDEDLEFFGGSRSSATPDIPDDKFTEQLKDYLLKCDNERAGLDAYDENILFDPNRGHWDLWDIDKDNGREILLSENFVARNPIDDVSTGIVAIDFGTSRTVVVYENEHSQIIPLQVGSGSWRRGLNFSENYENPTVIQFIDIESFLMAYYWREGRPFTRWSDVKISHAAFDNMTQVGSEKFYSFLTDLKHWCGSKVQFMLRDEKKFITQLAPFAELAEDEINPLEIYAYYLGLFINNMQQERHIFLNYILSFPVTYERPIREKMRRSFERGLMKSLPTSLLSNAAEMKKFSVREGASEAAAYAITALQEYGFDPEDEEEIYYAVFDFGGGTTDFDFGFLRESSNDRYDYVLVHFGENGDRTLGGENLLKLLAFEVFKSNQDALLHVDGGGKIPFTWAADKKSFAGSEALIKDSQEAHSNMHALVEKLRPVWETPDSEAAKKISADGSITINLFRDDGQLVENFRLAVTIDLQKILRDRIRVGINNFFISMKEAFDKNSKNSLRKIKSLNEIEELSIFLAGNSSKSPIVNELFAEYLSPGEDTRLADDENPFAGGRLKRGYELKNDYFMQGGSIYRRDNKGLEVWLGDMDNDSDQIVLSETVKKIPVDRQREKSPAEILFGVTDVPEFKIYPALGTEAAHAIQKARGVEIRTDMTAPTGKTGVAFGLLLSRAGGLVKTKHITPDPEKTPFSCYVGRNKKRKFKTVIDRTTKFDVWYPFIDAGDSFDIFYTNLPEAASNQMSIQKAKRITIHIDNPDENATVFIRAVKSNVIEYQIATSVSDLSDDLDMSEQIELS